MTTATVLAIEALTSFKKRYGVEPYGVLMSPHTIDIMVQEMNEKLRYIKDTEALTFCGLNVFESMQMPDNQVRFVM